MKKEILTSEITSKICNKAILIFAKKIYNIRKNKISKLTKNYTLEKAITNKVNILYNKYSMDKYIQVFNSDKLRIENYIEEKKQYKLINSNIAKGIFVDYILKIARGEIYNINIPITKEELYFIYNFKIYFIIKEVIDNINEDITKVRYIKNKQHKLEEFKYKYNL